MLDEEFAALTPREVVRRARILAFRHDPTAPAEEEEPGPALVAMIYPERGERGRVRTVRIDCLIWIYEDCQRRRGDCRNLTPCPSRRGKGVEDAGKTSRTSILALFLNGG